MPSTRVRLKIDMNVMLDPKFHRKSNLPTTFFGRIFALSRIVEK